MAFTKVVGAGIHTLSNITSHNINSSGIITATKFVGPMENGSGISTFYDLRVTNNLTVDGTTTTLDTKLVEVDKIEVEADSTNVAIAVTQTGSGDLIRLYDGASQKVTVDSEGKVGIGTDNPNSLLHIQSGNPGIRITDSNQAADNKNWIISGGNTQLLRIQALNDAGSGGGSLFDFYRSGNNINEFRGTKSGNTWFVVDNLNKQVGIGTDNPFYTTSLDVLDSTSGTDEDLFSVRSKTGAFLVQCSDKDAANPEWRLRTFAAEDLVFSPGGTGAAGEKVRIRSDGKVGIGTDMVGAPASNYGFGSYRATGTGYLYTETGQSGASAGLRAKAGTSDFTIFTTQGVGQLAVYDNTNSAERLRITSGGNVNIGTGETTQTARMLNVYGGAARVTQTSGGNTIEAFGGTTSGQSYGLLVNAGTTANDYAATFRNSSGTTMFRVRGDGNVGIGTDNPLTELHVHGETFTDITIHSQRTSGNIGGINFRKGGVTSGIMTAQYLVDVDGSHYFYSQGSQRLKSASDGDLTITGSDNAELKLKAGTSTGNDIIAFLNSSGTTKGQIFYDTDNNFMVFKTNGTASSNERLRITSGGTVGINDSSPNTYFKLDVNGHTNIVGDVALPTTNRIYFGNSDTAFIKGEHGGSAYLAFGANNEKMRLTRAGYLGIGTDNPLSGTHISDGTAYGSPQNPSRKATLTISAGSEGSSDIQLLSANYNHIFFGDSADPNTGIIWYEHTGGGTDSMNFATAGTQKLKIDSDGQVSVNYDAHHTSSSGILNAIATISGRFAYKSIEIGAAIADGTDQGSLIVGRRKAASSIPTALLGYWDDGTNITMYHGGGWSTHSGSATIHHFYTDGYTTSDSSGSVRLSIGKEGQIYLNNRDGNNSSHKGNIIAYAPISGRFAYKSIEIGALNPAANDNGGLIVAQRKGTTAYPFALMGSWDNGTVCNIYYGGGWGSQSANATHHKFYTGSYASSGGSSGSERLRITNNGKIITNEATVDPVSDFEVRRANAGGDVAIRIGNNSGTNSGTTASLYFTTSPSQDFNTSYIQAVRQGGKLNFGYATNSPTVSFKVSTNQVGINTTEMGTNEYLTLRPSGNNMLGIAYKLNNSNDVRHQYYDTAGVKRGGFGFTEYANNSDFPNYHDSYYWQTNPGTDDTGLRTAMRMNNEGVLVRPYSTLR